MNKRRQLLKGLTVAGAAGAVWQKPLVQSTVLPAHAATTVVEFFEGDLLAANSNGESWYEDALDVVVPNALAQGGPPAPAALCVVVSGGIATITGRNNQNTVQYGGTVPIDGTSRELSFQSADETCDFGGSTGTPNASIIDYTPGDTSIIVELRGNDDASMQYRVRLGTCNFDDFDVCI